MKTGGARTGFARRRAGRGAVVTAVGLLAGASAWAAHPLITDDTDTQGTGHGQLEVNSDPTHSRADGATSRAGQFTTTLTHGLTDELDLALSLPLRRRPRPGLAPQPGRRPDRQHLGCRADAALVGAGSWWYRLLFSQ